MEKLKMGEGSLGANIERESKAIKFNNVTLIDKDGQKYSESIIRPAKDGSGDWFISTPDGKVRAFIQKETLGSILEGSPVIIDLEIKR